MNDDSDEPSQVRQIFVIICSLLLLGAIVVPNYLRSRKRARATRVLQDLRAIDAAIDQYAIENHKSGGATVTWTDVRAYLKGGSLTGKFDELSAFSSAAPASFWSPLSSENGTISASK